MLRLLRGLPGHPSHPPLTDASIGAYSVGVVMLIAGALGLQEPQMAHGALLAISGGLLLAAPTAGTGLLDWWSMQRGSKTRRVATIHLLTMITATLLFAGAWLAQRPGYVHGQVRSLGLVLGLIAELTLAVGGWIGGSLVFVHGHRVLPASRSAAPDPLPRPAHPSDASVDGDAEEEQRVARVRDELGARNTPGSR